MTALREEERAEREAARAAGGVGRAVRREEEEEEEEKEEEEEGTRRLWRQGQLPLKLALGTGRATTARKTAREAGVFLRRLRACARSARRPPRPLLAPGEDESFSLSCSLIFQLSRTVCLHFPVICTSALSPLTLCFLSLSLIFSACLSHSLSLFSLRVIICSFLGSRQ